MSRELLQRALEYLTNKYEYDQEEKLIAAIKAELAKPEPEPVAIVEMVNQEHNTVKLLVSKKYPVGTKFYTSPPEIDQVNAELLDALKNMVDIMQDMCRGDGVEDALAVIAKATGKVSNDNA